MGALNDEAPKGSKKAEFVAHEKKYDEARDLIAEKKLATAEKLLRENLEWSLANLEKNHEVTVGDQETLAFTLNELGKWEEAKTLNEAALDIRSRIEGRDPPSEELLDTEQNLARDYLCLENNAKAAELYEANYNARKANGNLGPTDMETLRVGHDLASCWHRLGKFKEARTLNKVILSARKQHNAPASEIILSRRALAMDQFEIGNFGLAKKLNEENIEEAKNKASDPVIRKALSDSERALILCNEKIAARDEKERVKKETAERKAAEEKAAAEKLAAERIEQEAKAEIEREAKAERSRKRKEAAERKEAERQEEEAAAEKLAAEKIEQEAKVERSRKRKEAAERKEAERQEAERQAAEAKAKADKDRKKREAAEKSKNESITTSTSLPIPIPEIKIQSSHRNPQSQSLPKEGPKGILLSKTSSAADDEREGTVDAIKRPRAKSQDARDRIQFRHVSSSEALSKISNPQKASSPTKTQLSIPGAWVAEGPSNQHPSQSSPELSRSKSLSSRDDKTAVPPRPKSASPKPEKDDRQHYRQLFDAHDGKEDYTVDSWLYRLRTHTQKLLTPLRRAQCKRVKIAILDTGIDLTHPAFKGDQSGTRENRRIKKPEDFLDPGGNAFDTCGHGTHCVGLLRLVAPEADIYVARVAKDFKGNLDPNAVAKAIQRACSDGKDSDGKRNWNVDVLTMSFGFYGFNRKVNQAIADALRKETPVLVFAAASNNGNREEVTFPASVSGVICVNSANGDGVASPFNPPFHAARNFSIVGENVKSSWTNSTEKIMSGTSVATPIAAAVAALVLEFVLQEVETDDILKKQYPHLKGYDGMVEVLSRMSQPDPNGRYQNITPWKLLRNEYGRIAVASDIRKALWRFLE